MPSNDVTLNQFSFYSIMSYWSENNAFPLNSFRPNRFSWFQQSYSSVFYLSFLLSHSMISHWLLPRTVVLSSGNDRNRPESSGKSTVSDGKAPEIDGKRKQYSGPEDRWLSGNFWPFPTGRTGILPEGTEKIPARNTASMKSPEFPGTDYKYSGCFFF